ncbi:MAG TPA: sulfite exporter TauE/SafE family protein [Anaerolineae bacterium]|nr:sulfite exporter TauE/SafE family protein [Anaerolineae bacterium]
MDTSWQQVLIVLGAGLVAGFVNTMAGGGSFITLPALMFAGVPAAMANGTNRVAIEVGAILSVLGFRRKGVSHPRLGLQLAIPASVGAILGANVVIDIPELVFHRILAVAMVVMLAILILNPKKWLQNRQVEITPRRRALAYLAFLALGFYGGAIQAGIGFLLIATLVLAAGQDLVHTNSTKVLIVSIYTLFALGLFAVKGEVNWPLGLLLSVGNGGGGWLASQLAVEKGDKLVRVVLGVMLALMAVRYLGMIPWL